MINLFANALTEIKPSRYFNLTYIILDFVFLAFLVTLMAIQKKKLTLIWSFCGGLLYLLVDFFLFYLVMGTRVITINGEVANTWQTFLVLFWLSLSYGIPNFCFIWLALRKDKNFVQYTFLICGWWLVLPTLSQMDTTGVLITTSRESAYHWFMALMLVLGYGAFITYSLFTKKKLRGLIALNLIGFFTQFSWEFALLVNGIRPMEGAWLQTLLVNSIVETNQGMPYFYLVFLVINHYFTEQGKLIPKEERLPLEERQIDGECNA